MPSVDHTVAPQQSSAPRPEKKASVSSGFIPHVQGLRAIAVLFVVIYHFWPARLSGGYVGVDVFFVISGFLITAHIARELTSTGTIKLARFWARRARRLLPASLLVLLVCVLMVGSPYLMPTSALPQELKEIAASTFYVQNWFLAAGSTDYLALSGNPTTVQHYWSLSLEEQFYVMWPLLLLLAAWLGVKFFRGDRLRGVLTVIGVITVITFIYCVWLTLTDPAPAYFVTFGRMWQFGVGGLIALVPRLRVQNVVGSFIVGWAGIAALLYSAVTFDGKTAFPGYAALIPTLGAAAVIAASNTDRWWYPTRLLSVRPMTFTGDISYSLYLWHWPLIVVAPSVPFWGLTIYHRLTLLVLCFVLAWLTKKYVEDPVRLWRPLADRKARVSLWASLAAMLVVAGSAGGAWAVNAPAYNAGLQAIEDLRNDPPPCFGALSVLDPSCADTPPTDEILPAPGFAIVDRPTNGGCFVQLNDSTPAQCDFGSDDPDAPRVLLIGDSHAFQVLSAFRSMAEDEGWHLTTFFKGACPWNETPLAGSGSFQTACQKWRDGVTEKLADQEFDVVFTASLATTSYTARDHDTAYQAAVEGYRNTWKTMTDKGTPVITVIDNPVWDTDPNKCLRTRDASTCTIDRTDVLVIDDPLRTAAADMPGVTLLDFTDVFCDDDTCFPVIGGANVYRDQDHLTATFVGTLIPQYREAITAALRDGVQ
ncbi:acyltransferase family protein [Microbacterium sp. YY-01]|uniref:acyltransferase family protein n=1 Tax=Microbacterium sp. YY-01 TaxID=3421634 RepID=UPI003D174DA6